MKKSGSIKRQEFIRLPSTTFRRQVEWPGKPPLLVLPTSSATAKKESPIKSMMDSPNYMKSTTSSDAKKERAQVSSRSPQTSDSKSSIRRNLISAQNSSAPGLKQARILARTSSLKLMRTLSKTPSFRPTRASARKCSPVMLCENPNVQRIYSSTLKDHNFAAYLTLTTGAKESGGISVVKVCRYTYCSLNGHHHDHSPPLKCFLSAKRRTLKAQRSIQLGCLSPDRTKPHRDIRKEIEAEQMNFVGTPPIQGGSSSSTIAPLMHEEHAGFFIEIYSKEREDNFQNSQETTYSSVTDIKPSIGVGDATRRENVQEVDSTSDEPLGLGVDSLQSADQSRNVTFLDMDADQYFRELIQNAEVAEEVSPPNLVQGRTKPECQNLQYKLEIESAPSIHLEKGESETSDTDWEAGLYSASCIDDEPANPSQINGMTDLKEAHSALDNTLLDEFIFKLDKTAGGNYEEDSPNETMQEAFDAETVSEPWSSDDESESTRSYKDLGSNKFMTSNKPSHNSLAPEEQLTDTEEDDYNGRSDEFVAAMAAINSAPLEKEAKKPSATGEDKEVASEPEKETSSMGPEVCNGTEYIIKTQDDNLTDHQKYGCLQDDAAQQMRNQEFQCHNDMGSQEFEDPRGMSENMNKVVNSIGTQTYGKFEDPHDMSGNLEEVLKKSIGIQTGFVDHQSDALIEACCFTDKILDGTIIPLSKDPEAVTSFGKELLTTNSMNGDRNENIDTSIPFTGMENFTLLQDSDEAGKHTIRGLHDESQLGALAEEGEPNKSLVDEAFTDQAKNCSSVNQPESSSDDQDSTEKDGDEAVETAERINLEDQTHSQIIGTSPGDSDQDIQRIQVGNAIDASGSRIKDELAESDSYEELAKTCRILKGANRALEENKQTKEFNPRAPNFLPVEPDPEAEKVDLKHLILDEKKNAEEWMLDHALQQAVTKLAPARKRKVELLVEAFDCLGNSKR